MGDGRVLAPVPGMHEWKGRRPVRPKVVNKDVFSRNAYGDEEIGVIKLQVATMELPRHNEVPLEIPDLPSKGADEDSVLIHDICKLYPRSTETEVRIVYCCPQKFNNEPFYFSHTGNKILVLDKRRIVYVDENTSEATPRSMSSRLIELYDQSSDYAIDGLFIKAPIKENDHCVDLQECSDQDEWEEEDNEAPIQFKRVGTIMLQVAVVCEQPLLMENKEQKKKFNGQEELPLINDSTNYTIKNAVSKKEEYRTVFCTGESLGRIPYYLSRTGNRVFVLDPDKIEYIPGKEPQNKLSSRIGKEKINKDEDEPEKLSNLEECSKVPPVMNANDKKIGTIFVQWGMIPGSRNEPTTVIRDVFCGDDPNSKPYYLTYTNNKIFVVDNNRIILDNPPVPKRKRRPYYV